MDVGCGGLATDGGPEGEKGNSLLFKVAHKPAAFDAIGAERDIDAAAVVKTHGAVEGGIATGADGEFVIELSLKFQDDALKLFIAELGIALEACDAGDGAVGDGRGVGGTVGHLLFGPDHGGDFGEAAGALLDGGHQAAGGLHLLFVRHQRSPGSNALADELGLLGEARTDPFQTAGGGPGGFGGLFFGQVLEGDAGIQGFGNDGIVLRLTEGGECLFQLPAAGGAGFGKLPDALHLFFRLTHGGGLGRGQQPGGEDKGPRPATDPHYTLKCSTTKNQELYLQARTPRKQPKRVAPAPTVEAVAEILEPTTDESNPTWLTAARAAEEKQAVDIHVLDLRGITTMADFFLVCHGRNARQNQAICDEIEKQLKAEHGERPLAIEGLTNAEWILMDYGDLVVHIFSEAAREYYDLERLYRDARRMEWPAA